VRNETSSLRGFTATSEQATSHNGPYTDYTCPRSGIGTGPNGYSVCFGATHKIATAQIYAFGWTSDGVELVAPEGVVGD
jgi:hypothetical protein